MTDIDIPKNVREFLAIHEFSAYFIPGLIFLYCVDLIYPQIGKFTTDKLSIGSLILFAFLAYPLGHIIQGVGNLIEKIVIEPIFGDLKKCYEEKLGIGDIYKLYYKAL